MNKDNARPVIGFDRCGNIDPYNDQRVWFERTKTGGATIYLFEREQPEKRTTIQSEQAFGWVAAEEAKNIWLPVNHGWCNWYAGADAVVFTDYLGHDGNDFDGYEAETNFARQNRFWLAPSSDSGQQPGVYTPLSKETEAMAYNPSGAPGTLTTVASSVLNRNKESAVRGAYLEAGRIATDATAKLAAKHLPMMLRGYADTAVGKIVLANLAQAAVAQFRPAEPKLVKLTQAMADNAFAELYQSFDVQGFIDSLLTSKEGQAALARMPD